MHLVIEYPLDHHQAPCYNQRLHGVGECVRLVCPCYIGGSRQDDSQLPLLRRRDQLMYSPVLEYKAQQKHQDAQSVVYDLWRNLLSPSLRP